MSAVHTRWELVEPLLFAHALRDPAAFYAGEMMFSRERSVAALNREFHFDPATIAQAVHNGIDSVSQTVPIYEGIQRTARLWLIADGDHWSLRMNDGNPGHEIVRWRGISVLIPPSILTAGALADSHGVGPSRVQVLPDVLAPSGPVGHLHVHLGPMLPFEVIWFHLWQTFLRRGCLDAPRGNGISAVTQTDLPHIGHGGTKRLPGLRWQFMLELAFAARLWLEDGCLEIPPALLSFGRGNVTTPRRETTILNLWARDAWRRSARRAWSRARDVATDSHSTEEIEVRFQADCLRRSANDEHYARIFYQYLRIKVALYRQLVVNPWVVGLRHFLDVVQRDGPYLSVIDDNGRLDKLRLSSALSEKPLRVETVEIHVAPTSWLKHLSRCPDYRHAWILSFVRARRPRDDDPDGTMASRRWREVAAGIGATCRLVARRLERRPTLLRTCRAISLMDWERNGPVWLFERHLRNLINASVRIASRDPRRQLQPLRTALHLGEDFDHLLTGLRQIFEPFLWGLIRRGDRIGHALALGRSPGAWCAQNPWVRMRPFDRILDIGFVFWAFSYLHLRLDAEHIERLRSNAGEAIRSVFGTQSCDPLDLALGLWLSLPRTPSSRNTTLGVCQATTHHARSLLERLVTDPRVGRKALTPSLALETSPELPVMEVIHAATHDRVARMHVAIEVNPSSNLLIGGFQCLFEQPAFHTDQLPVILSVDDPLTFGTTLADEYAYAWAGMVVGMGNSPSHATKRLDEAARLSLHYAFTQPKAP